MSSKVNVDSERLAAVCRKWRVGELWVFWPEDSDGGDADDGLSVAARFEARTWSNLYEWITMEDELGAAFSRDVFLVDWESIRDPVRREEVMRDREVVYEA